MEQGLDTYFHHITGSKNDFDRLMHHIADAPIVMLGEATHGTHEFYEARAEISKRLIEEKGFSTILIEGDWPDTYRVNRYITNENNDTSAKESLSEFKRFPAWMWRNESFVSFIEWMKIYNQKKDQKSQINIFGLDVYSLHRSIEIVIKALKKIDPKAAEVAKKRYQCFDAYANPQDYGYEVSIYPEKSCRDEAFMQLVELKKKELDFFKKENLNPAQEKLYIEQNALVVKNAEQYYTSMFEGTASSSWNIRDKHMMETMKAVRAYAKNNKKTDKVIIWAHNSHVGNADATQMASYGQFNIGQLAKEAFNGDAIAVGFTTFTGEVSAASAWGGEVERKKVRPALKNSIESFFHEAGLQAGYIIPSETTALYDFLDHDDYLQRAIGVVYLPQSELQSHYFYARLTQQFDAVIHYDITNAVEPLEKTTLWQKGEEDVPETYPFGV